MFGYYFNEMNEESHLKSSMIILAAILLRKGSKTLLLSICYILHSFI